MARASQPQVLTSAPGYAFAWAASLPHDSVVGIRPVVNGTAPTYGGDGYNGQVVRKAIFAGGTVNAANLNFGASKQIADVMFNSGGGTLHILFKPKSFAALQILAGKSDNNIAGGWGITCGLSGGMLFSMVNTGSDADLQWATVTAVGTWVLLSATTNGNNSVAAAGVQLYTNGRPDNGTFATGSGTCSSEAAQTLSIGGAASGSFNYGASTDANSDIALFALMRRRQTAGEVFAVAKNPWSIFATRTRAVADAISSGVTPRQYGTFDVDLRLIPAIQPTNVVYRL